VLLLALALFNDVVPPLIAVESRGSLTFRGSVRGSELLAWLEMSSGALFDVVSNEVEKEEEEDRSISSSFSLSE
jgi:hypothetical protein